MIFHSDRGSTYTGPIFTKLPGHGNQTIEGPSSIRVSTTQLLILLLREWNMLLHNDFNTITRARAAVVGWSYGLLQPPPAPPSTIAVSSNQLREHRGHQPATLIKYAQRFEELQTALEVAVA